MLDIMLNDDDDEGKRFSDDKIISMLISYTFAGFESSTLVASKAKLHLEQHPHILKIAKVPTHYLNIFFLYLVSRSLRK